MDALAEKLDARLREWRPDAAAGVRERVTEVIRLADADLLDIAKSRAVEQQVLDYWMSPAPGELWLADLGLAAKKRPVVVVSRRDPDPPRALILYVPLTTQNLLSSYEIPSPPFPFLDRESQRAAKSI